jgi:Ca-activated chloride channel homolog
VYCEAVRTALVCLVLVASAATAHAASAAEPAGMVTATGVLPQIRSDIRITVDGAFADVTVTQVFRNDLDRGVEAVYVFPLPGDAAVRAMQIRTGGKTITASVERREAAVRAYEEAVASGVAAALTEQERANVFTQQVTGIAARDEVEVELRFDMTIGRGVSGWELVLPLVVAPRHVPGKATGKPSQGTGTSADTDVVDDASRVSPPVRGDRGGNPATVVVDLGEVAADDVDVPTHDAEVAARRGRTLVTVRDPRSDRDLVVRWRRDAKGSATARLERHQDGGAIAVVIEAPRATAKQREARRWLLVLDASGSMAGDAVLMLRKAAGALIDAIGRRDQDAIALITPDRGAPKWRRGARGRTLAKDAVAAVAAGGGTSLRELIADAIAAADGDDVAIVLVSDGLVADDAQVAAAVDGVRPRVHTIGVGAAPNRWLLDEVARRGRGVSVVFTAGDDVADGVAALVTSAGAPAVTPEVDWGSLAVRDVVPSAVPAVAAGRSLVVAARLDKVAGGKIKVRAGQARFQTIVAAADAGRSGLIGRRWARARVEELVATGAAADEIARLGVDHALVTPHTALVARGEEVTVAGGVRTTVAIPVAMPAGMRWQAVFGRSGDIGKVIEPTADDFDEARDAPAPAHDRVAPARGDVDADDDAETILLHGDVILRRTWAGTLGVTTGVHTRGDTSAVQVGAWAGFYRRIGGGWRVGMSAKLQVAPSVAGGVDVAAYATARRFVAIGGVPLFGLDLGGGMSLDVPGLAWRIGLRLGPWRLAPVLGVDQAIVPSDGAWTSRTTLGIGLEIGF